MTCAGWVVEGAEEDNDDSIRPGHRGEPRQQMPRRDAPAEVVNKDREPGTRA
jgi:hypothetical protein